MWPSSECSKGAREACLPPPGERRSDDRPPEPTRLGPAARGRLRPRAAEPGFLEELAPSGSSVPFWSSGAACACQAGYHPSPASCREAVEAPTVRRSLLLLAAVAALPGVQVRLRSPGWVPTVGGPCARSQWNRRWRLGLPCCPPPAPTWFAGTARSCLAGHRMSGPCARKVRSRAHGQTACCLDMPRCLPADRTPAFFRLGPALVGLVPTCCRADELLWGSPCSFASVPNLSAGQPEPKAGFRSSEASC